MNVIFLLFLTYFNMQVLIIIKFLSLKNGYLLLSINTLEELLYRIEASICSNTHTYNDFY